MDRQFDTELLQWSQKSGRKPLVVRGARQIGKTFSVRKLGRTFKNFIEINFELEPDYCKIFNTDLVPQRILREISVLKNIKITPGETLLFFDEIQVCTKAIMALRYFYEMIPSLHVIAAGSLLEFELKSISIPVGRIEFCYVRPFTFKEFLCATGNELLDEEIRNAVVRREKPGDLIHQRALALLKEYYFIGGMPAVINKYIERSSFTDVVDEQRSLIQTYRADFVKYSGRNGIEKVETAFVRIPHMVGEKTVLSRIDPDARSYQVKNAIDSLTNARVVTKVSHTSGTVPLHAYISEKHFKCIFIDVGLMHRVLNVQYDAFINAELMSDAYRGSVAEQFAGQELLNRNGAIDDTSLYYWHREVKGALAEVDYLLECSNNVVPVEIKSSPRGHMRSMHQFFATYKNVPGGIKCSPEPMEFTGSILTVSLYALAYIDEFMKILIERK